MNKQFKDDEPYNQSGFVAFTADYLLQKGYCCGNGCQNCPFNYKNVPEPKKTELIQKQQSTKSKQ